MKLRHSTAMPRKRASVGRYWRLAATAANPLSTWVSPFALDHHRGSEEHQFGEYFHDPALYDSGEGLMDTFREFRRNIREANLDDTVVPVVAGSEATANQWQTPLAMVFIDGGHSLDAALTDYRCWTAHLMRGGILAIHDLFEDAHAGGQAPFAIYRMALASGLFADLGRVNPLGLLRRL